MANYVGQFFCSDSRWLTITRWGVVAFFILAILGQGQKMAAYWGTPTPVDIYLEKFDTQGSTSVIQKKEWARPMEIAPLFGAKNAPLLKKTEPMEAASSSNSAELEKSAYETVNLKGIIQLVHKNTALAMIDDAKRGSNENVYTVGDTLPGGYILHSIFHDHIMVNKDGRQEKVFLDPERNINHEAQPKTRLTPAREASHTSASHQSFDKKNQLIVDKKLVQSQIANLAQLSQTVQVQIYKERALQKGYRLTGQDDGLLGQLGLRAGDVVLELNGTKLTSHRLGLQALTGLVDTSQVRLVVLRDGKRKNMTYYLK